MPLTASASGIIFPDNPTTPTIKTVVMNTVRFRVIIEKLDQPSVLNPKYFSYFIEQEHGNALLFVQVFLKNGRNRNGKAGETT